MAKAEEKGDFYKNKRKFDEIEGENGEDIELSLGLSLNGRFGVDPNRNDNAGLVRSSSVSNFLFSGGGSGVEVEETAVELGRTWSMPSGTEEEWRKRKEVQSMRRMEAKRKRVEKMMGEKIRNGSVEKGRMGERHVVIGSPRNGQMGERHVAIGLQGSGSSGASASEVKTINQGSNIPVETRNPGSAQSQQNGQKQTVPIGATPTTKPSSAKSTNNEAKDMMKNVTVDMPCVSTRGVGPSGKKIEGFLYRYRKGEDVRIVCVCHGSFLSPAEFVKHAGGGDVSQPLKHIVVNPSPLL